MVPVRAVYFDVVEAKIPPKVTEIRPGITPIRAWGEGHQVPAKTMSDVWGRLESVTAFASIWWRCFTHAGEGPASLGDVMPGWWSWWRPSNVGAAA